MTKVDPEISSEISGQVKWSSWHARSVCKQYASCYNQLGCTKTECFFEIFWDSSDLVDKVNTLFRNNRDKLECDFCDGAGLLISHERTVVFLLRKLLNDVFENINYFIYELDYGRKYESGMIKDEKNQDIDFSTAEKLYDYLAGKFFV